MAKLGGWVVKLWDGWLSRGMGGYVGRWVAKCEMEGLIIGGWEAKIGDGWIRW